MKEEKISLYYKDSRSDKVYNALLLESSAPKGWTVEFAYGRRGSALVTGSKTLYPVTYPVAKKIFDKLVIEKTGKGYKIEKGGSSVTFSTSSTAGSDTGHRPQLLNPIEEEDVQKYLESDGWCMQEKFDGRNRLLIKQGSLITGTNRKGLAVSISDEIMKELKSLPDCILAGEDMGNYVVVFDAIHLQGGYSTRMAAVVGLLKGCTKLVPAHTAYEKKDKMNWLKTFKRTNAEGVVFKELDASYTPGRPASGGSQVKFKFYSTASLFVTDRTAGKRSVVMGIYDGASVETVGSVTVYANQKIPNIGDVIEVRYLYAYKGGSLFQPVLLSIRDDVDQKDCKIEQLKYKKEEE